MCDFDGHAHGGWRGWPATEAPQPYRAEGPWFDLTHPIGPNIPRMYPFPPPTISKFRELEKDRINISEFRTIVHIGTHVDSPRHFYADGPAFEDIPVDRLTGQGFVVKIEIEEGGVITPQHFEAAGDLIRAGDILALDTGWPDRLGTDTYLQHPSLNLDAAAWLIERGVKLLAVDFGSPDLPTYQRQPGFDWPVHRLLLQHGVLISEHFKGHPSISGKRTEFIFGALNIEGCDGAPSRVLGRPITG